MKASSMDDGLGAAALLPSSSEYLKGFFQFLADQDFMPPVALTGILLVSVPD